MSRPFIVLGDRTDHGGEVVSAAPTSDTHGKPLARIGDKVTCRRCRGMHSIVQGDLSFVVEGSPVAYHG